MKFAFSNIAWAPHDDPDILSLLRQQGVTGIEIAPTRIWPKWENATAAAAELYGRELRRSGFDVAALQAVLFERADARLFSDEGESVLLRHLKHVAQLAGALGAPSVVFGAPRQRDRGRLSMDAAIERAAEVFCRLGETFSACGTCLCIEPIPRTYGCNFIVNSREGADLVRLVNHSGFRLHLDSAAMFLEGEDVATAWLNGGVFVRHFHITEPELGNFCNPRVPHKANLEFLDSRNYSGWCSVEMREQALPLSIAGPWSFISSIA